jgi:hypothetical protein
MLMLSLQVDDWLGELLWETGKDVEVYRMKGVFHVYGSDKMHMLQVRSQFRSLKWCKFEDCAVSSRFALCQFLSPGK